jgi:hypothetical protein
MNVAKSKKNSTKPFKKMPTNNEMVEIFEDLAYDSCDGEDKVYKPTKADKKRWAERALEEKRVKKLAKKQAKTREELQKKSSRGLEPTHAIISCPDCAAQLLIGVDFMKHRI